MHKNAIDVKPGGVVRLYFGFDTKSGPQWGRAPAIRSVNFGPACMILNGGRAKHQTEERVGGGGWGWGGGMGGIDLSPMDVATQASRLSCIYVWFAISYILTRPRQTKNYTTFEIAYNQPAYTSV